MSPAGPLLEWLAQQTQLVRLPIVLSRGDVGFLLRDARIGSADDAIVVRLDDTALGIGIADHARARAGTAATCTLWLEGYWRGEQHGSYLFSVRQVHHGAPPEHAEVVIAD